MATILVVDDRKLNRKFLALLLGYAGHTVLEADDGAAALRVVRERRPELVVTDLLMPVMDGIELAKCLQSEPALASIPVIFYTATYRVQEARQLAASCGVVAVLAKPSEPRWILAAVASALGLPAPSVLDAARADAGPPGGWLPSNVHKLSELHRSLQRALDQGMELIGKGGDARHTSDGLVSSFATVQALSLRLAALLELGMELASERAPGRLLETFCRAAQDILGTRYVGVGLLEHDGRALRVWSARGLSVDARAALGSMDPRSGFFAELLAGGSARRVDNLAGDPTRIGLPLAHPPIESVLALPIRSSSATLGWFYVAGKLSGGAFTDDDEQFAATLAAQFALAYGNLVLHDELQEHAGAQRLETVERLRTLDELRESELRFRQVTENIREVFFLTSRDGGEIIYVSPSYERVWGRSCASLYADPASWTRAIHPDDCDRISALMLEQTADGSFDYQYRVVHPDGTVRWVRARGFPIRDAAGSVHRVAGLAEDITERREQEIRIHRLSRLRAVVGGISSAILRLRDPDELLHAACRVAVTEGAFSLAMAATIDAQTGEGEVIAWFGRPPPFLDEVRVTSKAGLAHSSRPASRAAREMKLVVSNDLATDSSLGLLRDRLVAEGYRSLAVCPLVVDGRPVAVLTLVSAEPSYFDDEEIALLEWISADLSYAFDHIEKAQRLDHLAYFDTLTGLPNSTLFRDRLLQLMHTAAEAHQQVCLLLFDLERFSEINDTLGRTAGDALLKGVGAHVGRLLTEPCTLARISGDTFAAASMHPGTGAAVMLRDEVFGALREPIAIDGKEFRVAAQAGIAIYPDDGGGVESLFRNAEAALKEARSSGQRWLYYSPEMHARMAERRTLEDDLRTAVAAEQFVLHYQPRVDLVSGELVGGEALVRWLHPERGLIGPAEFIGLAEETGLIVPLGEWVIRNACAQQARWLAAGVDVVPLGLNLSALQFRTGSVLDSVRAALQREQLDPRHIEVELTESAAMDRPEDAARTLHALRELGVSASLDDFGTGFSSLAYLKRFPLRAIKIDRTFITDITRNPDDAAIATAVIAMAHRLGLRVVAEGVETEAQMSYLRAQGCDEMQGFHFSAAVPAAEFEALLRSRARLTLPLPAAGSEQTLLIVDDEHGIRAALTRALRRDGYRILTASSGEEGLELLALNQVQVIVSDQRMPEMSGADFLSAVKTLHPDTIRIILSGYTDLGVVTDAVNRGAVYKFLTKPWDDDLLREQIRDAFRRYRPTRADPANAPGGRNRARGADALAPV